MFSSLDRVDIAYTDPEGRTRWLQSDHRRPAEIEAEAELSLLFALIRVLNPRRDFPDDEPEPVLEYRCQHPPPGFIAAAVAGAGAELVVDGPVPYREDAPDPEVLADLGFAALAARVAGERGVACDPDGLRSLAQQQPRLALEDDEIAHWRAVLSLAAVAGEVLRARAGGRWALHPRAGVLPFVFLLGPERASVVVDPLGAAIDHLENGADALQLTALISAAEQVAPR